MTTTAPHGYGTVTPWIIVRGAARFLDFLAAAFGARETARVQNPDSTIGHAEAAIGDSVVMMFDAADGWPDTPAFLRLYVSNADDAVARAIEAGCTSVTAVTELFWGDKVGRVRDPWGNLWWIQQHIAELSDDEVGRRSGEQRYLDGMQYMQESLSTHLAARR